MADNAAFEGEVTENGVELKEVSLEDPPRKMEESPLKEEENRLPDLLYSINDVPPWYLSIVLGFQQYLTMFGSNLAAPLLIANLICVGENHLAQSEILGTMFFVSGLATLLQSILGNRLPIIQGASFSFISPVAAIMSLDQWKCPDNTLGHNASNVSDAWKPRMCEVQGAIMLASVFEVVIGFTGLAGMFMRFIGPLTIAPTIALIGISLVSSAVASASTHWGISWATIGLIALFSQYLRNVKLPCCRWEDGHCVRHPFNFFTLFPVIMSIGIVWLLCYVLTIAGAFPTDPKVNGYQARTDIKVQVLQEASWFRMPYPGQWGLPTVSVGAVFGMLAGVIASMIESIGDYYACARLSGAPPPPVHAINRGIFIEGIGCVLTGAFGSGTGTTSYGENIGAIGITKVGSRRVTQVAGCLMVILGLFGKFGALFVTLPEPIVGGIFMTMFGVVTAVGLSNLQFVDQNSSRNLFVVGFAIFCGVSIPQYVASDEGKELIRTGNDSADQIILVLLSTSMFVGGFVAAVLDNTIPGSKKERGLIAWTQKPESTNEDTDTDPYDLPFRASRFLEKVKLFHYIPICPVFRGYTCGACDRCKRKKSSHIA